MGRDKFHEPSGSLHPRSSECSNRLVWMFWPSNRDGVVTSSSGCSKSFLDLGDCSLHPHRMALQEDAFLVSGTIWMPTPFPHRLIHMVLNRLLSSQCLRKTLIAPCWLHLKFFANLPSLVVDFTRDPFMVNPSSSTKVKKVSSERPCPEPSRLGDYPSCSRRTMNEMTRTVRKSSAEVN